MSISETAVFRTILAASVLLSVGGVLLTPIAGINASHGGRGGAIAVAISLFALFATRNHATYLYDALTGKDHEIMTLIEELTGAERPDEDWQETIKTRFAALERRLELEAEGQFAQNLYLAFATAIGTIFWGFGDIFSGWFSP